MSSSTQIIKNVTLVGANGSLGSVVLRALLESGSFRVSIIHRASSRPAAVPTSVQVKTVSDAWTTDNLTDILKGEDAVIACFPIRDVDEHLRLANAAARTGTVRRFIPADFGSVDARSERARELVNLFERKVLVRERLEELAGESTARRDGSEVEFTWTSLVNGHFFDWGLRNGFLHFYTGERKAEILGNGREKSSTATLGKVAQAVVRVLERFEETRNRVVMVQSFCVSQLEVLRALERVEGREWRAEYVGVEEFIGKYKALADGGDKGAVEDLVFALGVVDGNWEGREDFAMGLLGLEEDDLDTEVKKALEGSG